MQIAVSGSGLPYTGIAGSPPTPVPIRKVVGLQPVKTTKLKTNPLSFTVHLLRVVLYYTIYYICSCIQIESVDFDSSEAGPSAVNAVFVYAII